MDLIQLRGQIDAIDDEIIRLFCRRMKVAADIAAYKKEHNLPILVPAREAEKLQDVAEKAEPELESFTRELYITLFRLSREYQAVRNEEVNL
jgi:chorismate mutase